jgi:Domain of unknown function (DUF5668)
MATDPPNNVPPPAPAPPPPGPGATREEWRAWRRQQRHQMYGQWPGGWYGPWGSGSGGWPWFWGAALILIGGYFLLQNLGLLDWLRGDVLWPALLILVGVALLIRRSRDH